MKSTIRALTLGAVLAAGSTMGGGAADAQSVEEFYKGRMLSLIIGFAAGDGGYDITSRLFGRYVVTHIPGKPNLLPLNMPGAGGRNAATHAYNIAPKDGSAIVTIEQSLPLQQALGEKFQFDVTKFNWVGNMITGTNVLLTWHASGVKSIDDAKKREVTIGATGSGSSQQPKLMNLLIGTKFKIVSGYQGGGQINLAMERGEVDGRTNTWTSVKSVTPDWLPEKKITILTQIGLEKASDLPDVPLMMDLGATAEDRTLLKLLSTSATIGRSLVTTPSVPAERVAALRAAFDATAKDPAFLADAAKAKLEFNTMSGAQMEKLVADIIATPKDLTTKLANVLAGMDADGR